MISLDQWANIRTAYSDQPNFRNYPDVVNAAWQCLGPRGLDRDSVKAMRIPVGSFHPRIWRGIFELDTAHCYSPVDPRSAYGGSYVGSNVAISSIFDSIEGLFLYLEPANENLPAFGHRIREMLILACTEVESAWRSVLEVNGKNQDRYTTKDYCHLIEPLRLKDWTLTLTNYPDLGTFSPFSTWSESSPTSSLPWYDGYNAVKHHREGNFKHATLGSLINAAAALHVMQAAQFGPEIYDRFFGTEESPFYTTKHPVHDFSELYAPDFIAEERMSPTPYW